MKRKGVKGLGQRGGMEDTAEMYRAFRGRDPKVEPLLIERGLKDAPKDEGVQ